MKKLILFIFFLLNSIVLLAGEKEIISMASEYYSRGMYHSAVSEAMRYQFIYPEGDLYPQSLFIMGNAYFRGDNYSAASDSFQGCFDRFPATYYGEASLCRLGYMRLSLGSPFFSLRTFQKYDYVYPSGRFSEDVLIYKGYAKALIHDHEGVIDDMKTYREKYPEGKYAGKADELEGLILNEINRPRKSMKVAVLGSLVLPGFGHFYTGNIGNGVLSLCSNALFIGLIYHGYRQKDIFQIAFFSLVELSFYQYSLVGAMRDVHEYNSSSALDRQIRLSLKADF